MLAQKVTYTDYDGEKVEEIIRLNLTQAECYELDDAYKASGGIINHFRHLLMSQKEGDPPYGPMLNFLKCLISVAYGKRTEDGKFVKKEKGVPLFEEFEASEAYSALIIDLMSGKIDMENFLRGIFPPMADDAFEKNKLQLQEKYGV